MFMLVCRYVSKTLSVTSSLVHGFTKTPIWGFLSDELARSSSLGSLGDYAPDVPTKGV